MAVLRRFNVKKWMYRALLMGVLLFIMLKERSRESDSHKLVPLAESYISSSISSTTSAIGTSTETTYSSVTVTYPKINSVPKNHSSLSGTERPQAIQETCRALNISSDLLQLNGRFVSNRSLYYCNIPKCASAFMEQFLSGALQCRGLCDQIFVRSLTSLRSSDTLRVMSKAYSFMFVREPYARLFSAYENKLFLPNKHWKIIGKDVIKTVRPNATIGSKLLGHDVTFLELVKYVLTLHERGVRLNDHLTPMYMYCDTCQFRFNFIGKLETMSRDLVDLVEDWKLKGIGPKNILSAKEIEEQLLYKRSFGPYKHMFSIIKQYGDVLSRYKLFQRAWSSYQIRGLILKRYTMPFTENEVANINYIGFGAEIKKAVDASQEYKDDLKHQREEALVQAYRSVPTELMLKLKDLMKPDCLLFGYDEVPKLLFYNSRLPTSDTFDYFKGL